MTYTTQFTPLTENQKNVIPHFLEHVTIEKTAARTGLSESMLRDWYRQPAFKREMEQHRRDLARSIMYKLEKAAHRAVDRLLELMADDEKGIALKASIALVENMASYKGVYGMHETIDTIEEGINKANKKVTEIAG